MYCVCFLFCVCTVLTDEGVVFSFNRKRCFLEQLSSRLLLVTCFPRFTLVTRFSELHTLVTRFPALHTGYTFSRASHTGYTFSRACPLVLPRSFSRDMSLPNVEHLFLLCNDSCSTIIIPSNSSPFLYF